MGKLDGKVAIVTGAGRGIGRAIAEAYLKEGASLTITAAQSQAELDQLAGQGWSKQILPVLADVTDADICQQVVDRTVERFGRLDILVNNAGRGMKYVSASFLTEPTRFWEVDPATWRMIVDTNVNGPFHMARAAVGCLLASGRGGTMIGISASYSTMKRRGYSPYGPTKAMLEAMSAIWAEDLAGSNIRVNVLLPGGATDTGMVPDGTPADIQAGLLRPEIMGPPAVFLASDASRALTGRRLIATEWTETNPEGSAIVDGIG